MRLITIGLFLLGLLGLPLTANAFGLRTHLFIADEIIADITPDCRVTIRKADFYVPLETCDAIRSHPEAFRAGAIGPDGFPDFIAGQVTTHPGVEGDWQTSDWLVRLNERASSPQEIAFAAGYIIHAASDILAHSYVNIYSGGIFELTDERRVELRHFVLEKYIDYHLPSVPSAKKIDVPLAFLSKELIFDADVNRVSSKSKPALHIAAMGNVRAKVVTLDNELRQVEDLVGNFLAMAIADEAARVTEVQSGEESLTRLLLVLGANKQRLEMQKSALDLASRKRDNAEKELDRLLKDLGELERMGRANGAAISANHSAIDLANELSAQARDSLNRLAKEIALQPPTTVKRVCREVGGGCSSCGLLCAPICAPAQTLCSNVEVANEVYERLLGVRDSLDRQLFEAQNKAISAANDILRIGQLEADRQISLAALNGLIGPARDAATAAKLAFEAQQKLYDLELYATDKTSQEVEKLRAQVSASRKKLFNAEQVKTNLREIFSRVQPLSGYTSNWITGIDRAGVAYIDAGRKTAISIVQGKDKEGNDEEGNDDPLEIYVRWLACHGGVFGGIPYQGTEAPCVTEDFLDQIEKILDDVLLKALPEPYDTVVLKVREIKKDARGEFKTLLVDTALKLAEISTPDRATYEFIEVLVKPEYATREKLREVFATVEGGKGKDLLAFPDAAMLIDEDLSLKGGKLNQYEFKTLEYAVILSRLALLDRDGIQELTRRFGGNREDLVLTPGSGRYSILYETIRSIDGNHQWQPFGLPYPRASVEAEPKGAYERHFGYGPPGSPQGFPLYINPNLRRDVFSHLFPDPFIGAIGEHPRLQPINYGFATCSSNPFPTTFNTDGSPRSEDATCESKTNRRRIQSSSSAQLKRAWYGFLEHWLGVRARPKWSSESAFVQKRTTKKRTAIKR